MAKSSLRALLLALPLLLSACGGGGGGSTGGGTASGYTVGGSLSGLATGTSVTLYNKQTGEHLTLGATGTFAFTTTQASGANYAVTVSTPPTGQSCSVTDGLGVVGSANVTTIEVACTTPHSVGGTVSGLGVGKSVTLIDNSLDSLQVNGVSGGTAVPFTFGTKLAGGQAYDVQIASQPVGVVCQVTSGGSGTVSTTNGVNVSNVQVTCASPSPEYLYVATTNGAVGINPYSINLGSGALTALTGGLVTTSQFPVALAADSAGAYLYTIGGNGGANNVTGLSVNSSTGAIAVVGTPASTGIDPYGVTVSPNRNFVYVANNNDNDISIYSSSAGVLSFINTVASGGSNPQALVFNPAGTYLYVVNSGSNTITTFAANASTGALTPVGSPMATGVNPYGVQASVTPGGTFLYVANYGSNSISGYSLGSNGLPSPIAGSPFAAGTNPFAVTVNPAGTFAYVANENDGTVSAYAIDPTYGSLTPVGTPQSLGTTSQPVGLAVDPSGQFLYVSNKLLSGDVWAFDINQSTGALSSGASVASGLGYPRPLVAVRP